MLCWHLDELDLDQESEGRRDHDFGFLITEPNDVVAPIHPKAAPVILTKPEKIVAWLTAPAGKKKDGE